MGRKYGKPSPRYYTFMWAVGIGGGMPGSQGSYPGAFPQGFIPKLKRRWWGNKRLWLFSGSFSDPSGIMVDIKPDVFPTVQADCEALPFKDESFDFVMMDPPYSEEEALSLYGTPYFNLLHVLNEAARVCEPGGYVLLLHRLICWNHPEHNIHFKRLKVIAVGGVYKFCGWTNIRALTVWQKQHSIESFEYCENDNSFKVVG